MDYLLRISPPWGFRVKRADDNKKSDTNLIEENYILDVCSNGGDYE